MLVLMFASCLLMMDIIVLISCLSWHGKGTTSAAASHREIGEEGQRDWEEGRKGVD
jgi:hypothetical protein